MSTGFPIDEAATKFDDLAQALAKVKNISVDDALKFLGGGDFATKAQWELIEKLGGAKAQLAKNAAGNPTLGARVARFAGGNAARNILRLVPGLTIGAVALDAADIVAGGDSLGNKAMDTAAMGIGGTIGGVMGLGNPLAIAGGASLGKLGSDAVQFLGGGGKSAEQRKLEEALLALRGGGLA